MLKALKQVEFASGLEIQIAMEERMGCAMGVCLGCVIPTRRGPERVCRDGPVFDLKDMLW
jgi:dihydroorotate dehydrogenase electron transfer subunit